MPSNAADDNLSLDERMAINKELLASRANMSGTLTAALIARFGHFLLFWAFLFVFTIAPRTLIGEALIPQTVFFGGFRNIVITAAVLLFFDYIGRALVRGLSASLYRQLEEGTSSVRNWRRHLLISASRLPIVILMDIVNFIGTLVGLLLLVIPGFYFRLWSGPAFQLAATGQSSFFEAFSQGREMTQRYRDVFVRRILKRAGWRIGTFISVGVLIGILAAYAPVAVGPVAIALGVIFVLSRPALLYFGMLDHTAFIATLQEHDGRLAVAEG